MSSSHWERPDAAHAPQHQRNDDHAWMARNFPDVPFERFADDAVVHCNSQQRAHVVSAPPKPVLTGAV